MIVCDQLPLCELEVICKMFNHTMEILFKMHGNYELFVGACNSKFTVLAGDDVNSLSIYVNGGHGCASVASNIMPDICYELHAAARAFDMKKAKPIHAHLYPIYDALFCRSGILCL